MAKLRRLKAPRRVMLNEAYMLCRRINPQGRLSGPARRPKWLECGKFPAHRWGRAIPENQLGFSRLARLDFPRGSGHIPRNFTNPSGGSSMKEFFTQFFTWWNGQTLGTRFFTWRKGVFVGTDEFGNTYYRSIQPCSSARP